MLRKFVVAALTLGIVAGAAYAQDRACTSQKGSFLVLPKVELRWTADGSQLTQDTFVSLANDGQNDVQVKVYYLNGDDPLAADPDTGEREHPGCNVIDFALFLTAEEPYYWSLAQPTEPTTLNQLPRAYTQLDFDPTGNQPGRPDPLGNGDRVLRGAVIMYATTANLAPIRYNRLAAKATIVNYASGDAYEYNAWSFQNTSVDNLEEIDTDNGALEFGSGDDPYDYAPGQLLLDFFADGSSALGMGSSILTELTLWPLENDLTGKGDVTVTLVRFVVHNQNEVPFTWTQDYCLVCWDSTYLSNIRPDVFLVGSLQTNKGKARIDGVADPHCDFSPDSIFSVDTPLLGVATKIIDFGGDVALAASPLVGQLDESADLQVNEPLDGGGELKPDDNGSAGSPILRSNTTAVGISR